MKSAAEVMARRSSDGRPPLDGGLPAAGIAPAPGPPASVLPASMPPRAAGSTRAVVLVLAFTTALVSAANYAMTLVAAHLLPAAEFTTFAAGQNLLLVVGTGSTAALPWAVARYLSASDYEGAPGKAMMFGLTGSVVQAIVLGAVALPVCWALGGLGFGLVGACAAVTISLLAGPSGYLQGRGRLAPLAGTRVTEAAVRIGLTLALLGSVSHTATAGIAGFVFGSLAALCLALWFGRSALPLRRMEGATYRRLSLQAAGLGGIQLLLAVLAAADGVLIGFAGLSASEAASYQTAALIGRIPLFLGGAIALATYTAQVAAADDRAARRIEGSNLRTFAVLCVPFVLTCLTVPAGVLSLVVPADFGETRSLLAVTCFSGVAAGLVNIISTTYQARRRFGRCLTVLGGVAVLQTASLLALGTVGSLHGYAITASLLLWAAVIGLVGADGRFAAGELGADGSRSRWGRATSRPALRTLAVPAAVLLAGVALLASRPHPALWWGLLLLVAVACLVALFRPAHPTPQGSQSCSRP